ncbi:DMT family transporter [Dongia deserti]|uniref:DMT family transporter n=1 Tax=Dongia deserti TaxID=2268030 RepID=UPI000E65CBD6|nr:DMT family transporter [Dongia deserti]
MAEGALEPLTAAPTPPRLRRLVLGPLALLAMGAIWGLGFALAKLAGENGAHPIGLVLWETIGSGSLLLTVCILLGRFPRRQWSYLRYYLINGLLGFTIPGPLLFWVAPHLPVAVLTLMIPMAPLLTYVLILFLRTERFDIWRALGVLMGFVGVGLIVLPEGSLPEPGLIGWVLLGLAASCFYALQNLYIALRSPPDADVLTQTTGMLMLGGLAAIPLAAGVDGFLLPVFPMTVAVKAASAMLLINAAMMLIFVWVVRAIGPVFASQTANVIVLAGVFWGWVIFDEILSPWVWGAILAMAAGVALVTLRHTTPAGK